MTPMLSLEQEHRFAGGGGGESSAGIAAKMAPMADFG